MSSHRVLAEQIAGVLVQGVNSNVPLPIVEVCGGNLTDQLALAASASASLGLSLSWMSANAIPTTPGEIEALVRF